MITPVAKVTWKSLDGWKGIFDKIRGSIMVLHIFFMGAPAEIIEIIILTIMIDMIDLIIYFWIRIFTICLGNKSMDTKVFARAIILSH